MVRVGLLVRLRAKPGKEDEVSKFLAGALPAAQGERQTTVWFALRLGPSEFPTSSTRLPTRRAARRTSRAPSPRR